MASISLREYIRWLPDDASEPTSTLVVTSPERHFVDIRANRPEGASKNWPEEQENISPDQLDWAIAGRSSYWKTGHESPCTRGRWEHWIDSRTTETDGLADEGDNYSQEDGNTLEKGTMLNPATGRDTEYEELWRDIAPKAANSENIQCAVLQIGGSKTFKGSVVLVGQLCQGILRNGDEITVERWQCDADGVWGRLISIGQDALPCLGIISASHLVTGETMSTRSGDWKVIEASGY